MNKEAIKIITLSKYSYQGASSRYRFYNYQECFKKENINMSIKPLFGKRYLRTHNKTIKTLIVLFAYLNRLLFLLHILIFKNRYRLIIIEYELFPYLPPSFEYLLDKRGIKYIVDYDDAIFHKYDSNPLLKNKIAKVIEYASCTIVCNEYLKEYASRYTDNIIQFPTVVILDRYKKKRYNQKPKEKDKFIIGWIGSKSTSRYILDILPAMKRFVETYSDVYFNFVGFDEKLLSHIEQKEHHIHIKKWSEESEIDDILEFDIGIMPLDNTPWSKGKCGFKLIQYMSSFKPIIASPVGINRDLIDNKVNGFLASSRDEWFDSFEKLYFNRDLAQKMATKNLDKINIEYNHKTICKRYIKLIRTTIKG
ncbi:MAG: glycosyltransferase family 4 protein [Sulfurovum sp.]